MSYSKLRMKHQEKNKLLEKNRILLRYAYGLVLIAITAVYFLDDRVTPQLKRSIVNSPPTSIPQQKTEIFIEEPAMKTIHTSLKSIRFFK